MRQPDTQSAPAYSCAAVTPSDSTNLPGGDCRALYVGVTGDITLDDCNGGTSILFKAVPVGILPVSCRRVRNTGTTASQIVSLY